MRILPCVCLVMTTALCGAQELPEVPPVDLAALSPDDFSDDELDIPYYLEHFHTVANAVVTEGEDRGFIDIAVWRRERDNEPYNARVMENHLSLAWFYCTDRPWNPYHGHPAVRARLEAMLDFWVRMQHEDGRFSEYGPQRWNLPATAFATKFMGRTLQLLADGPPIDEDLHRRVIEADRRAIMVTLSSEALHRSGRSFANQYSNVWAGALAYLDLFDDDEMRAQLELRLAAAMEDFMSPAGYFYEANGPDWGYNMGTEHSNLRMAHHYARGTPLGDTFVAKVRLWNEWLSYNAVPEPGRRDWALNHGIEARTSRRSFSVISNFILTDRVPLARVWAVTREGQEEDRAARRAALVDNWPQVRELRTGDFSAFSPYAFLHRDHDRVLPSEAEREEALTLVPHIAQDSFIHQRVDGRFPVQYTFVRRPGYYAALNTGQQVRPRQRYGLGLVWTPQLGALMQSQVDATQTAWGTVARGAEAPYEAGSLDAQFTVGDEAITPEPGARNLPDGDLHVRWPLGEEGHKTVVFTDDEIEVSITHPGAFTEQLPLLLPREPSVEDGAVVLAGRPLVEFGEAGAQVATTRISVVGKRLWTVTLAATDELAYRLVGDAQ